MLSKSYTDVRQGLRQDSIPFLFPILMSVALVDLKVRKVGRINKIRKQVKSGASLLSARRAVKP